MIEQRYVQALLGLSEKKEDLLEFEKYLKNISYLYTSNEEFQKVLINPCISVEEKWGVVEGIIPEISDNSLFVNFIKLLLENGRISNIDGICKEYVKVCHELEDELDITIIVANRISDEEIKEITEKYKKIYHSKKVNYTIEEEKSMIGGIKVIINNTIYDSSLKTQINSIF